MKKKTYIWMMSILLFAITLDTIQGMLILDDVLQAMQAQQQPVQGIPGTVSP